tara:strand:+ start:963 stop:3401 length:2439 start_codon:yes stop_codon:yes gene_type:complete
MIEQDLFKKQFVGRDGFIWWVGQIATESYRNNLPGSQPGPTLLADQPGFGYRYQVRIMGYHSEDPVGLPDADLPWASVMYPVTAGGGGGTRFETPKLTKGDFVYGFFIDGEDAQQPVIMGVIGYNQYQEIPRSGMPFTPFRGFDPAYPISNYGIDSDQNDQGVKGVPSSGAENNAARELEAANGLKKTKLDCANPDKRDPTGIAKEIKDMIQDIQEAQRGLKNFKKSITHPIQFEGQQISVQEYIAIKTERAAELVTGYVTAFIKEVKTYITRKINAGLQDLYFILFPDKQQDAKQGVETAMDLLTCLFKRIIKNLLNIVRKALLTVQSRYINVPLCAAENIIAAIIGKLSGLINSFVAAIMKPLEAILGVVDIAGDVLQIVLSILSYLDCQPKPECPEIEDWSLWDGVDAQAFEFYDPSSLIEKIKGFAGTVSDAVDPDNFDFDSITFDDIFVDTCNTDAVFCGPPRVVFWGGSGSGASGNAIVSAVGDILGVDIINGGTGYSSKKPFVNFVDDCGHGAGATGTAVVDDNGVVVGVTIDDPGFNYLPVPDGSQGGDGRTWAQPEDTTVKHPDGTWDIPYSPGEFITLLPGDIVRTPPGSEVLTPPILPGEPGDGTVLTPVQGQLTIPPGTPTVITEPVNITAPPTSSTFTMRGNLPIRDDESYPVILFLCDYVIKNRGFGYQPTDKIIIEPSNGAEMTPQFGELGELLSIKITSSGTGFTQIPRIYIESETGYNAIITPRFCIDRVGVDDFKEPEAQDAILSVIDCVGNVPVGYVNNKPYYGPYHEHENKKMVGAKHSNVKHNFIDDRKIE